MKLQYGEIVEIK